MNERSLRSLNLVFRFALELVVLLALLWWGFSASGDLVVQLVLGVGAVAIVIAVWGTFVAPKASRRLDDPLRLALEIVVFGAGVLAFIATGQLALGIVLALAVAINLVLMYLWNQRGH